MTCRNCGAYNEGNRSHCQHCHTALPEAVKTAQYTRTVIQTPLRQARPSDIISANPAVFYAAGQGERPGKGTSFVNPSADEATFYAAPGADPGGISGPFSGSATKTASSPKRKTLIFSLIALAALLCAGMGLYLFLPDRATHASFVFAEAEKTFTAQKYSAALLMYQQFIERFPGDYLVPLAQERIRAIHGQVEAEKQQKIERMETLLQIAREAFRKQRYLKPAEDNVLLHTSALLQLDPANSAALELQAAVVQFYQQKAEEAFRRGYYNSAIDHYENVLRIMPNDSQTLEKISQALEMRKRGR